MKPALLFSLTSCITLLQAQNASPNTASEPAKLTEAQVSNVLSQLQELEKTILAQRNTNLSSILAKLNDAISSDQAAVKFYTDCDVLVNSERKEGTKAEARQRAEQIERAMDRSKGKGGGGSGGASADEGEMGLAIRLGLRYLILTLEAHESKDEDFKKMAPKLQAYIQDLVAAAPKLKGRAMNNLARVGGNGSPVVEAFQLDRFLNCPHWSRSPVDFGDMYEQTLLYLAEEEAKDSLPGLYDSRINSEAAFRKEQMPAPEYALWLQGEYPALRWERATYLYEKGSSPVQSMGDMLKVIKEFPGHADAPKWVAELRSLVNESSVVPATSAADKPGTN